MKIRSPMIGGYFLDPKRTKILSREIDSARQAAVDSVDRDAAVAMIVARMHKRLRITKDRSKRATGTPFHFSEAYR